MKNAFLLCKAKGNIQQECLMVFVDCRLSVPFICVVCVGRFSVCRKSIF